MKKNNKFALSVIWPCLYHVPCQTGWEPVSLAPGNPSGVWITGFDLLIGIYKKEEAHLLLKSFQIKGPIDIFVSKFENDNWGLDGYVSNSCEGCNKAQIGWELLSAQGWGRKGEFWEEQRASALQNLAAPPADGRVAGPLRFAMDETWSWHKTKSVPEQMGCSRGQNENLGPGSMLADTTSRHNSGDQNLPGPLGTTLRVLKTSFPGQQRDFRHPFNTLLCNLTIYFWSNSLTDSRVHSHTWQRSGHQSSHRVSFTSCRSHLNSPVSPPLQRTVKLWICCELTSIFEIKMREWKFIS